MISKPPTTAYVVGGSVQTSETPGGEEVQVYFSVYGPAAGYDAQIADWEADYWYSMPRTTVPIDWRTNATAFVVEYPAKQPSYEIDIGRVKESGHFGPSMGVRRSGRHPAAA